MSEPVNDYISSLEQQLRQRGIVDPRILAEAREHLVDAVDDARQRGLSLDEAEREALARFGAPEVVAAHVLEERERMKPRFAAVFGTMWQRKWWILVPTLFAAIVTSVASHYFLPARYQSEATILIVPTRPPSDDGRAVVIARIEDQLRQITAQVTSRTRLATVIKDLGLYQDELKSLPLFRVVEQMQRDIHVAVLSSDVFSVSFVSSDPGKAMRVAERLATFVIDDSLRGRTVRVESTKEFIDSQIEEMRGQILAQENYLETLRAESSGRPLSQAYLIPYETLKESYKALLAKQLDATIAANVERRQIGEQFRILDAARVPQQPIDPGRFRVTVMGALVGLAVGLVLVVLRRSSNTRPPALAQA